VATRLHNGLTGQGAQRPATSETTTTPGAGPRGPAPGVVQHPYPFANIYHDHNFNKTYL